MPDNESPADWNAARRRLQRGAAALAEGAGADPGHLERVYRKRAAELARPVAAATVRDEAQEVLLFAVGAERYALELGQVREVIEAPAITPIPGSPRELAGVVNARGRIEPVWETALLLGLPPPAATVAGPGSVQAAGAGRPPGYAVLLRRGERPGALRVDQLLAVRALRPGDWQRAAQSSPYSKGVTADRVTLLDAEALLGQGDFA